MKFNKALNDIKIYEAGKPIELVVREFGINEKDVIKLASNENPRGCSQKVIKGVSEILSQMSLYPDDSMFELKDELAKKFGVKSQNIIIGSGSDQIIDFAVKAKANEKTAILMAGITFAMYEIYAKQIGAKIIKTKAQQHDLNEFYELYKKHKKEISVIFLCIPNNPLGECIGKKEVYSFLEKIDSNVLVVVDGAYQEYAIFKDKTKQIKPKNLIKKFPNAIYLGTFSKAYGLGGMRCGYGIGDKKILDALYKLRPPFNITSLSLRAATLAIKDQAFVNKCLEENLQELKKYQKFAEKLDIKYIDSYTNFITLLIPEEKNSTQISDLLLKKGIIVRNLASYGMNAIRVTIGTKNQNKRFFEVFKTIYM